MGDESTLREDESTLREKARKAIQAGRLPIRLPERVWGGPGVGACCTICGQSAGPDEVEFELEFTGHEDDGGLGNHHVHVQCFAAWELERTHFEKAQGTDGSSDGTRSAALPASLAREPKSLP
jgi:hypothetical protein